MYANAAKRLPGLNIFNAKPILSLIYLRYFQGLNIQFFSDAFWNRILMNGNTDGFVLQIGY